MRLSFLYPLRTTTFEGGVDKGRVNAVPPATGRVRLHRHLGESVQGI